MKRFATYLFSLLALVVAQALVLDYVNVALIRSSSGSSAYKMERLYANPEPDELAIVGSSRACGNFVPSLIATNCFNYGVNGMTMGETISILRVLQKRRTTAPVIVNFDPWGSFFDSQAADYRLAPQSGRVGLLDRVPGIRFFGSLRKHIVGYLNVRRSVTSVVDRGAVLLKNSRTAAEWQSINAKLEPHAYNAHPQLEQAFLRLLQDFAPRRVFVVIAPCSKRWTDIFKERGRLEKAVSAMRKIPNVTVFNYYGSSQFTDADFTDPTHFNIKGARRFSAELKLKLQHAALDTP